MQAFLLTMLAICIPATAVAQSPYSVTDLGQNTYPLAINNGGHIAGAWVNGDRSQAFYYDGSIRFLGTLGGTSSQANALNSLDHVVGRAQTVDESMHAFFYDAGDVSPILTDIHSLVGLGGAFSTATAISTDGTIVGAADTPDGAFHAFALRPGDDHATDLHALVSSGGNNSFAWAISENGLVAGVSENTEGHAVGFLLDLNTSTFLSLGTLGWNESAARAVNDHGEVAGDVDTGPDGAMVSAFMDGAGMALDWASVLGSFGGSHSVALGINASGYVVGSSEDDGASAHAFIYDEINGFRDLETLIDPDSPWFFFAAEGINDAGKVVGNGLDDGVSAGFVLTPTAPPDSTPPEITPQISGTPGSNGWYTSPVSVSFVVTDPESAIASSEGCSPTLITNDTASNTLTCTATNAAGLTNAVSVNIKVDTMPPAVGVTGVANMGVYQLGAVPAAGCASYDAMSGIAAPAMISLAGGTVNGVGLFTATCSGATDQAGNMAAPVTATYSVRYAWSGFFSPVNNSEFNAAKAGRSIPLKWQIQQADGMLITSLSSVASVTSQAISCSGSNDDAALIPADSSGSSGLRYDPIANQFVLSWQTDNAWAGACRRLLLILDDGSSHGADFGFK